MSWTISENFGTYQGNTNYILDGNTSNCWRADSRAGAGQYVLFTSDQSVYVTTVQYITTQSSEVFGAGTYLQYSTDGSNYTDVAQFNGSSGQTFTVNANCRYLRIYCKSGSGYVSISELIITTGSSGGGGSTPGETKKATFTPAAFDSSHDYSSASNTANPIGAGSDSTSYANFYLKTGSRAQTYFSYSFDTSSIPSNAIIRSVSCEAKVYTNGTNSNRVSSRTVQLYSGSTAKGAPYTVAASTTPFTINCGTGWTREDLSNVDLTFLFVRGTSYTTTNYYVRFYGATLTVEYEIPGEENVLFVQVDGKVHPVEKVYAKQNGAYAEVDPTKLNTNANYVLVK